MIEQVSTAMRTRRLWAFLALAGVLALAAAYEEPLLATVFRALDWIESFGTGARLVFVACFAAAIILLVPATPLHLAAGVLFGWWQGTLLAFLAITVGGAVSFYLARHQLRERMGMRLGGHPLITGLARVMREDGLQLAMLIRLSPSIPAWVIHYGLGLTPLRGRHFLLASVATLPVTMAWTYYGKILGDLAALRRDPAAAEPGGYYGILVAGGVITVVASVWLARRVQRVMDQRLSEVGE